MPGQQQLLRTIVESLKTLGQFLSNLLLRRLAGPRGPGKGPRNKTPKSP